jgi:cysteine desulfurase/selenocysteine lyase
MKRFGVPATVRASFSVYNTLEDVDQLVAGLEKTRELFG